MFHSKICESITENEEFGVSMFDMPEMASVASFRVLASANSDSCIYMVLGLIFGKDSRVDKIIQVLAASENIGVKGYSSISHDEFDQLKETHNLVAIGEVL